MKPELAFSAAIPVVRPRVLSPITGDPMPADNEIRSFLADDHVSHVRLVGGEGSGKTTTLNYLVQMLSPTLCVTRTDEEGIEIDTPQGRSLKVSTSQLSQPTVSPMSGGSTLELALAPWMQDECLEYLLAVHPAQCGSVMRRLRGLTDDSLTGHCPFMWRMVLDEMAQDETVANVRSALKRVLVGWLLDDELWRAAGEYCLGRLTADFPKSAEARLHLDYAGPSNELSSLLRRRPVRVLLAAERILEALVQEEDCPAIDLPLPSDLMREIGALASKDVGAVERLEEILRSPGLKLPATAASILHMAGIGWRPSREKQRLAGAWLSGAKWQGVRLKRADLTDANLSNADLTNAVLDQATGVNARCCGALLRRASLERFNGSGADFRQAILEYALAGHAQLEQACFQRANLHHAQLHHANLVGANLQEASLRRADLTRAELTKARLERADLTGANLSGARLGGLDLRETTIDRANFHAATMRRCNVEFVRAASVCFRDADLEGSWLTGSRMRGADFRGAVLRNTGLADINWQDADLHDADLRGCSFHTGSSRCGLVGSPIACEGSRTGFYTDEYGEQYFKTAEEIRKANLCGAELRGANITGVDFYLVDLRGAYYDRLQREHFRRCRAIL